MYSIAIKMLFADRLKYYGLILGISFAAMLIAQQASILVGLTEQTGAFIRDSAQADLWIMDSQVRFSQDALPIRDMVLQQVRGVSGVQWAVPLRQGFMKGQMTDGTRFSLILVGIDDATLIGGPPFMVNGDRLDIRSDRAVFIDADAPDKLRMKRGGGRSMTVGDRFSVNEHDAKIVGSYRGRKSFFWEPVMYTTYSRALSFAPMERNLMSFVLVKVDPGESITKVAQEIESRTGLKARTNSEFIHLTARYITTATGILINFGTAVVLGIIIGLLGAGQTFYNFTLDNLRYYGALKAMGVTNKTLTKMVMLQGVVVAAIGYGLGVGIAVVMGVLLINGGLAFSMIWQIPLFTAFSILTICLLTSIISLQKVYKLEPAVVFKG